MTAYITLPSYVATIDQRYRLVAQKCKDCGQIIFPPRMLCPECGSSGMEDYPLSGKGEIYTYTVISKGGGPSEFDDLQNMIGAYAVAIVKLEEGPLVVCQLTDCDPKPDSFQIGMKVEAVVRRLYEQEGITRYCYKFRPVAKK
ncbi:Zn-ribbon domain-containing OB-fold protein [Chloroflexota bacterium]